MEDLPKTSFKKSGQLNTLCFIAPPLHDRQVGFQRLAGHELSPDSGDQGLSR